MNFECIEIDGKSFLVFESPNYEYFIVNATKIESNTYYASDFDKEVLEKYFEMKNN
jgi:hypothetical protein